MTTINSKAVERVVDYVERRMVVLEAFSGKTGQYADRDGKWTTRSTIAQLRKDLAALTAPTPADDVERLIAFIRGHHVYCTARDGRFSQVADLIASQQARIAALEEGMQFRPTPSETFAYQADGYASGWQSAIKQFADNARALLNQEPSK